MSLPDLKTGQTVAEQMLQQKQAQSAEPPKWQQERASQEAQRHRAMQWDLLMTQLSQVKKALNDLQLSTVSSTQNYSEQTSAKLDELLGVVQGMNKRIQSLHPAEIQSAATEYAAAAANKFDVYCERILTHRIRDVMKRLQKEQQEMPAEKPRGRWKQRLPLILSGTSCLLLLVLILIQIFN